MDSIELEHVSNVGSRMRATKRTEAELGALCSTGDSSNGFLISAGGCE